MGPRRLNADGAEKGMGVMVGCSGSPEKSHSLRLAPLLLSGLLEWDWSRAPSYLPMKQGWGRLAEAWLPVSLWPVLRSNPSTTTMYRLCDLQQIS